MHRTEQVPISAKLSKEGSEGSAPDLPRTARTQPYNRPKTWLLLDSGRDDTPRVVVRQGPRLGGTATETQMCLTAPVSCPIR